MYFSLWHWTPMVNGYSGFFPPSYQALAPQLMAFPRGDTVGALRRRGVTHVTVNCGLGYPGCVETARLMALSKDLRLIADTLWQGEPVQLYELSAPVGAAAVSLGGAGVAGGAAGARAESTVASWPRR
jgi:hypothetical protein